LVLFCKGYGFDKMDNIVSRITQQGSYAYGYDSLYRLNTVTASSDANDEFFTYDKVGNRQTSVGCAVRTENCAPRTDSYDYNENNEMQSAGNVSYAYDANGNTTGKLVTCDPGNVVSYRTYSSRKLG
jgi:hypothetical protein